MKRQFFQYKLGVIPLILLFCSVDAQTARRGEDSNNVYSKEVVYSNSIDEISGTGSNSALSTRALKNFNKTFKGSENVEWSKIDNSLTAQFTKDEVETTVFYNLKGKCIANIRAYKENKLPPDIRHRVRSNYYDYSIFHVQEVTVRDKTAYLVNIEDENFIKTIRITPDGEMNEHQVIEKSSRLN